MDSGLCVSQVCLCPNGGEHSVQIGVQRAEPTTKTDPYSPLQIRRHDFYRFNAKEHMSLTVRLF